MKGSKETQSKFIWKFVVCYFYKQYFASLSEDNELHGYKYIVYTYNY